MCSRSCCARRAEVAVHRGVVSVLACMSCGVRLATAVAGVRVKVLGSGIELQLSGSRSRRRRGA